MSEVIKTENLRRRLSRDDGDGEAGVAARVVVAQPRELVVRELLFGGDDDESACARGARGRRLEAQLARAREAPVRVVAVGRAREGQGDLVSRVRILVVVVVLVGGRDAVADEDDRPSTRALELKPSGIQSSPTLKSIANGVPCDASVTRRVTVSAFDLPSSTPAT